MLAELEKRQQLAGGPEHQPPCTLAGGPESQKTDAEAGGPESQMTDAELREILEMIYRMRKKVQRHRKKEQERLDDAHADLEEDEGRLVQMATRSARESSSSSRTGCPAPPRKS